MNWDAIGAVGEIIGATAVVVSVVYLAFQVRDNTRASILSATRDLFATSHDAMASITANEVTSEIWLVGSRDRSRLNHRDEHRFSQILFQVFSNYEQQYFHLKEKLIYSQIFDSQMRAFRIALVYPGIRDWWKDNKTFYDPEFQQHVEKVIEEHPVIEPRDFTPEYLTRPVDDKSKSPPNSGA